MTAVDDILSEAPKRRTELGDHYQWHANCIGTLTFVQTATHVTNCASAALIFRTKILGRETLKQAFDTTRHRMDYCRILESANGPL